ncbi:MAG: hypothetical protein OXG82_00270 [Gammaproteobacteria bacterium]|nr:hypothetical protein [Gammaproteobacteria bacterium]
MEKDEAPVLPPVMRLEWVDSFIAEAGWHDQEDVADLMPAMVSSAGFLVDEDDRYVRLALSMYEVGGRRHVSGITVIPTCSVRRREPLTSF